MSYLTTVLLMDSLTLSKFSVVKKKKNTTDIHCASVQILMKDLLETDTYLEC